MMMQAAVNSFRLIISTPGSAMFEGAKRTEARPEDGRSLLTADRPRGFVAIYDARIRAGKSTRKSSPEIAVLPSPQALPVRVGPGTGRFSKKGRIRMSGRAPSRPSTPDRSRTCNLLIRSQIEPSPTDEGKSGDEGDKDQSNKDLGQDTEQDTEPASGEERG